jgi:hypothetical protein
MATPAVMAKDLNGFDRVADVGILDLTKIARHKAKAQDIEVVPPTQVFSGSWPAFSRRNSP